MTAPDQTRSGRPRVRPHPTAPSPSGAPARIGATIGALRAPPHRGVHPGERRPRRSASGIAALKTIARFKQLDDRGFAEYYLLGTLASVSVAIGSAIVAQAALSIIP